MFQEVVAHLPPGLPEKIGLKAYSSEEISILTPKQVYSEANGFDCYKFLIHIHSNLRYNIANKPVVLEKKHLFPLNPAQAHAAAETAIVPQYFAIFMNKAFVRELAREMHLPGNLCFNNVNYSLSPTVQSLLHTFVEESVYQQAGHRFILQSLSCQLAVNILRQCKQKAPVQKKTSNKAIQQAIDFLHANYNQDFALDDIARTVSYSSFHFIRLFREHTGQTPFKYLLDLKLEKAQHLLQETGKSINEICFEIGFNNRSHFSTAFKRKYGFSPSQYRNSCR